MDETERALVEDEGFWVRAFAALDEPAEPLPADLMADLEAD